MDRYRVQLRCVLGAHRPVARVRRAASEDQAWTSILTMRYAQARRWGCRERDIAVRTSRFDPGTGRYVTLPALCLGVRGVRWESDDGEG